MTVHILGIRHHGVGSAQQVQRRLEQLKPDILLVEGPPEMEELLSYIGLEDLRPPVAVMLYKTEDPSLSRFYPFAEFSPEWIASVYANRMRIPLRCIDLPAKISLKAIPKIDDPPGEQTQDQTEAVRKMDPLFHLAEISGYPDSESWWEYQFERSNRVIEAEEHFEAVITAMGALREQTLEVDDEAENEVREAFMRQAIRQAQSEMFNTIVVVCGAWHAPALMKLNEKEAADLKSVRKFGNVKDSVYASWIPWTNDRLSLFSGYGAGIKSPGWYQHQWNTETNTEINWLSKAAVTLRNEGMDVSAAHVLESYRLAVALGQIRSKAHVMLEELNESVLTVMCMGDDIILELIRKEMIVGNRIGTVPEEIPKVPLQVDFERNLKALRLKLEANAKVYHLDLRKELDLQRSIFFYRLSILSIPWAVRTHSRTKGTFKESWTLTWQPEMMLALIDKSFLGNTIEAAAIQEITQQSSTTTNFDVLGRLLEAVIPAELHSSIEVLLNRMDELSSIAGDVEQLMVALPRLVHISRYGDVRKSDLNLLELIVQRLFTKIFINLPTACYGLDEDTSNHFFQLISELHHAIRTFDAEDITTSWHQVLKIVVDKPGVHDIIQGCTCRLLLDADILTHEETAGRLGLALSTAREPHHVASWIEGFLRGSGMILIYDNRLWNLLYQWIDSLPEDLFLAILPYVRRAFSRFQFGERRQIGEKARKGLVSISSNTPGDAEKQRMEKILPIWDTIEMLIGKHETVAISENLTDN